MAHSMIIEEDRGTFAKRARRHNGYYGGDFSTLPYPSPPAFTSPPARPRRPSGSPLLRG
jgi:hypothetical protein